jgi:hypothetical protein
MPIQGIWGFTRSTSRDAAHNYHERIRVMEMMKYAEVGLFLITITTSGLASADCPSAMPQQLLEDCIVYEGAGSSFPTSDYAHMDLYNAWLKQRESAAQHGHAEISAMEKAKK